MPTERACTSSEFNASLERGGENLVLKKYFHIVVAVDTPDGLVVPVIRDADRKGVYELGVQCLARARRREPGAEEIFPHRRGGGHARRPGGAGDTRRRQKGRVRARSSMPRSSAAARTWC